MMLKVPLIAHDAIFQRVKGLDRLTRMYATGLPAEVRLRSVTTDGRLPLVFEASRSETHVTNGFDSESRARRIFASPA